MVEEVEEFRSELQVHAFPEGKRKILDHGEIRVHEAGTVDRSAGSGAKFPGGRLRERAGIEPILDGVDLSWAVCTAALGPAFVWIAHLVGRWISVSVIGEDHARSVCRYRPQTAGIRTWLSRSHSIASFQKPHWWHRSSHCRSVLPLPKGRSYKTLAVKLSLRLSCDRPQSSF